MPQWFWYAAAGALAALTVFVLVRHFFIKKGDCCGSGGSHDCSSCGMRSSCKNKK